MLARCYIPLVDNDLRLLERWRAGDNRAGNDLFKRHFDSVWRFFDNKIDGDVDELVQGTFLACVKSRDRFRAQSSFRTYVFAIARNELYRFLRKRRRDADALDFGVTSLAHLGTTPQSYIARNEEHQRLLQALYELPVEQQVLLELHYWEEMTPSQLAEVFGIPPSTARSRLMRARQGLRAVMEKQAKSGAVPALGSDESLDAWARGLRAKAPDIKAKED